MKKSRIRLFVSFGLSTFFWVSLMFVTFQKGWLDDYFNYRIGVVIPALIFWLSTELMIIYALSKDLKRERI